MKDQFVEFPESYSRYKLKKLYDNISLSGEIIKLLRKYFGAMSYLYGTIPLRKVFEIINIQNPGMVTEEEFIEFAQVAMHESDGYCIMGQDEFFLDAKPVPFMDKEIISLSIFQNGISDYEEILNSQVDKPYYIPEKDMLLKYSRESYTEPTQASQDMKMFLKAKFPSDPDKAKGLFEDMIRGFRLGSNPIANIQHILDTSDFILTENELNKFMMLYNDFSNNMRIPHNRGFTPNEMASKMNPNRHMPQAIKFGPNIRGAFSRGDLSAIDYRNAVKNMQMPSEELRRSLLDEIDKIGLPGEKRRKIGRNEPCPCGSGKKYKKCCGR